MIRRLRGPWLYHYTRYDTAIERIFSSGTIRMGRLKQTNDPEEGALGGFAIGTNNPDGLSNAQFRAIFRACHDLSTVPVRLACFTQEVRSRGLRGYEHDRMWAQYAGGNTGICIAFDKAKLTASIKQHFRDRQGRLIHGSVKYVPKILPSEGPYFMLDHDEIENMVLAEVIKQRRNRDPKARYLRKTVDWIGEKEFRYVWIDNDDNYNAEGDDIPIADCVVDMCLGPRFPRAYELNAHAICESYDIRAQRITFLTGIKQIIPAWKDQR